MTVLLVLIGGALGAPVRYVVDLMVQSRHDSVLPWGTFVVNAVGSLVLGATAGAVAAAGGPHWLLTLVGTGICGALTTFSTFSFETVRLAERGRWGQRWSTSPAASWLVRLRVPQGGRSPPRCSDSCYTWQVRTVTEEELGRLFGALPPNPRVVAGGNGATPRHLLGVLDAQVPRVPAVHAQRPSWCPRAAGGRARDAVRRPRDAA
jgi:CrcB protein